MYRKVLASSCRIVEKCARSGRIGLAFFLRRLSFAAGNPSLDAVLAAPRKCFESTKILMETNWTKFDFGFAEADFQI